MELNKELKDIFIETAQELKGYAGRLFKAKVVKALGKGGQRRAAEELGWNRGTIRKGLTELAGSFAYLDQCRKRGRKPVTAHWPTLEEDLKAIAEAVSQTDPTFQTTRLYLRLSAAEVRAQLMERKGYGAEELPSAETIRLKLNEWGYSLKKVKKSQPKKKLPETDAIFAQLAQVNAAADGAETQLRLSLDAKATVLLGLLARGGYNRVKVKALDHDFRPQQTVTPVGIFLPHYNETYIFLTTSPVTSDVLVDCLRQVWLMIKERFPQVKTLVLNQDNGPECHSRRTQWMKRLTQLADEFQLTVQLAYYPPYHSKYNPIERVWGVLENYWRGSLLDTLTTVFHFAQNMTYNRIHPVVKIVETSYHTGVKLSQKAMANLEKRFERLPGLEKYFVRISPLPF